MQHRPKTWILLLVLIFVVAFEIGFQPIRFIHGDDGSGLAVYDYDFGAPIVQGDGAQAARIAELKEEVGLGEQFVKQFEIISPNVLRVATKVLNPEQRNEDRKTVLDALRGEYEDITATEVEARTDAEEPITKLGPIGLFMPAPKIRLGLDLQGGAHVVLQCKPSTELTFSTPQDYPMLAKADDEAEETADEPEAAEEGEAPATDEPAVDTEEPVEAEATEDAPTVEEPEDTDVDAAADETGDSLEAQLQQVMDGIGAEFADVDVVSSNLIKIRTRAADEDAAVEQQQVVLSWLQNKYAGVSIDAPPPRSVFIGPETAQKAKHIIDMRMYSMSDVKEPLVQNQGNDRIIVELPGVKDPARVTEILRSTASLEFRLVPLGPDGKSKYTCDYLVNEDDYSLWTNVTTGEKVGEAQVLAESEVRFTGADLKPTASVQPGQQADMVVAFELKEHQALPFAKFTRENIGNIMSIILDGETKMAPTIESELPGAGIIRGNMTPEQATDLKLLLNAGALPVPLEIVENRQVSATLGADSVHKSMMAGLGGLACVMLFMILYYRLPGLLANIALTLYIIIVVAALSTWSPLEATLTLPGIAGIILSIGMAVDANIIIFERLKEELRTRTTARAAAEAGFNRAWTAILDANVTTIMVAGALYFLGTSSIKSFAVTLFIGVLISLFTAVTVSRWLVFMAARSSLGEKRWWFGVTQTPPGAPESAGGSE